METGDELDVQRWMPRKRGGRQGWPVVAEGINKHVAARPEGG
jgi:hypothetical protein